MENILTTLLSYLLLYKYIALFAVAFSAAVIIPLPTDSVLVAIGAFAFHDYFSFWLAFLVTVIAEVSGDMLDYYLARKFGHVVLKEKYAKKYSFFTRLEDYFHKYTGLTIFFSRFVGIISPLTNFLSGFERIDARVFLFYDILGNAVDTVLLLSVGYFIGDNWENFSGQIGLVGTIIGILLVAFVIYQMYMFKLKNKRVKQKCP